MKIRNFRFQVWKLVSARFSDVEFSIVFTQMRMRKSFRGKRFWILGRSRVESREAVWEIGSVRYVLIVCDVWVTYQVVRWFHKCCSCLFLIIVVLYQVCTGGMGLVKCVWESIILPLLKKAFVPMRRPGSQGQTLLPGVGAVCIWISIPFTSESRPWGRNFIDGISLLGSSGTDFRCVHVCNVYSI